MILGGAYLENNILTYVGDGIAVRRGMLFALITVFAMFRRAKKRADEMDDPEREAAPRGEGERPGRYDGVESSFAYTIRGYRHADRKHKILMIVFPTSVLSSVLAGLICLFFKQFIAAYVLFGCFGLILFIGIAAAIVASRR